LQDETNLKRKFNSVCDRLKSKMDNSNNKKISYLYTKDNCFLVYNTRHGEILFSFFYNNFKCNYKGAYIRGYVRTRNDYIGVVLCGLDEILSQNN
jgi:hypothetical protein